MKLTALLFFFLATACFTGDAGHPSLNLEDRRKEIDPDSDTKLEKYHRPGSQVFLNSKIPVDCFDAVESPLKAKPPNIVLIMADDLGQWCTHSFP